MPASVTSWAASSRTVKASAIIRAQRDGQRLGEAQKDGLDAAGLKLRHISHASSVLPVPAPPVTKQRWSRRHVEHAKLFAVERHELLFPKMSVLAQRKFRRPRLAPQLVQRRDPPPVSRLRAIAEEPVSHRLEGFAQVRQILLADHRRRRDYPVAAGC